MEKFKELYQKAISVTNSQYFPESINDLLIKDLNEEKLSEQEQHALQNYYKFRNHLLANTTNDNDFADKIKKLRIIANFTHWQDFLTEQ